MSGQINLDSLAGQTIRDVAALKEIKTIVEIGAWNGLGSTACVLEGLKDKKDFNFISLESNRKMYDMAVQNNQGKPVDLIYGRIINKEDLFVDGLQGPENEWVAQDIEDYKITPNVIDELPDQIDFLILDGGEFSTRAEFLLLKDRSRCIFLDDTRMRKNLLNRQDLYQDKSVSVLHDYPFDRNGWALFRR